MTIFYRAIHAHAFASRPPRSRPRNNSAADEFPEAHLAELALAEAQEATSNDTRQHVPRGGYATPRLRHTRRGKELRLNALDVPDREAMQFPGPAEEPLFSFDATPEPIADFEPFGDGAALSLDTVSVFEGEPASLDTLFSAFDSGGQNLEEPQNYVDRDPFGLSSGLVESGGSVSQP